MAYQTFNTTSDIRTGSEHDNVQSIDAAYYNIMDSHGYPVAGLLVLLESGGYPVRAELHVDKQTPGHISDTALRQARRLLGQRYAGDEDLELRLVQTEDFGNLLWVPLASVEGGGAGALAERFAWWPVAATVAAIFLAVAVIWAAISIFTGGTDNAADELQPVAPLLESSESVDGQSDASAQTGAADTTLAGDSNAAVVSGGGRQLSEVEANSSTCAALPVSTNAPAGLVIGQRVRIRSSYQASLRTQPNAEAGQTIGVMADNAEATILDGPTCVQGDSDTIVWWYVRLGDGQEAWVAANTSELTLLETVN